MNLYFVQTEKLASEREREIVEKANANLQSVQTPALQFSRPDLLLFTFFTYLFPFFELKMVLRKMEVEKYRNKNCVSPFPKRENGEWKKRE